MFELSTVQAATVDALPHDEHAVCVREWTGPTGTFGVRAYVGTAWSWIVLDGVATYRFRPGSNRVEALPEKQASPATVEDYYRRHILPLVMQANGLEVLHASAILYDGGVVGFCADNGTGKSTIAYALSRRGFPQYADDALVVQPVRGGIEALSLPFVPRLRVSSAEHFGNDAYTNLAYDLPSHSERSPVRALFILERDEDGRTEAQIERLHGVEALAALLPHGQRFDTISFSSRKRSVRNYLDVTAIVPIFSVRFANAFERLDGLLDHLVEVAEVACPELCEAR
jgi:hypothetical protein